MIESPLKISGQARGTWFFEGDFPIVLKDPRGCVIAKWYASARGEWTTERFVPLTATLEFKAPAAGSRGVPELKKDNPSDRREFDDAVRVPIFFS